MSILSSWKRTPWAASLVLASLTLSGQALSAEECAEDADCGEYLRCLAPPPTCVDDGDGVSCEEPSPDASSFCATSEWSCESDADCPREFECIAHTNTCPEIACEDGAPDCRPCEEKTYQACQPKQVSCTTDADCPDEWSCTAAGDTPVTDLPTTTEPREAPNTQERERTCYPNAWSGMVSDGGEGTLTDELTGDDSSEDAGPQAGGGCSVSTNTRGSSGEWMLLLLPFLAVFGRRPGLFA